MKKSFFRYLLMSALIALTLIAMTDSVSAENTWSLQVSDVSNNTTTFTYTQLLTMPETTVSSPEYCYGSLVTTGNWTGVSLSYLLEQVGVDPSVASINFLASDGYSVTLQTQEALQPDVIIAYKLNNLFLPETLRLVVPELNGNSWIAMIISITMSTSTVSPGIPGGAGVSIRDESPTLTVQPSTQPTTSAQPQSTLTTPTSTPAKSKPTPTQTIAPPGSNLKPTGLPVTAISEIAIGIIVKIVIASFAVIRRRREIRQKKSLPITQLNLSDLTAQLGLYLKENP